MIFHLCIQYPDFKLRNWFGLSHLNVGLVSEIDFKMLGFRTEILVHTEARWKGAEIFPCV